MWKIAGKCVITVILYNIMTLSSETINISLSEANRKALVQFAGLCADEVGASTDDFLALHSDPPYPAKAACILKCLLCRVGLVREGQFSKTGMMTAIAPIVFRNKKKLRHLHNITELCDHEIKKSDPETCDVANQVMLCLQDHAPELLFNRISIAA